MSKILPNLHGILMCKPNNRVFDSHLHGLSGRLKKALGVAVTTVVKKGKQLLTLSVFGRKLIL